MFQNKVNKFKESHTFEKRKEESKKMREKYPDRVPVIVEKSLGSDLPNIDKTKYLVPVDLTIGQFVYVIRKRIKLKPEKAIFLLVNKILPPTSILLGKLYDEQIDNDGFLYIEYTGENTFG